MRKGHFRNRFLRTQVCVLLLAAPRVNEAQQTEGPPAPPAPPLPVSTASSVAGPRSAEASVLSTEIDEAIARLASPDFELRQAAQQQLVAIGEGAVPALAAAAQSDQLEVAVRCVAILRELACDEQHSPVALDALKHLTSKEETPVVSHATRVYAKLTQTELERAVVQLTGAGVHLHSLSNGRVTSATNLHRNSQLSQLAHFPELRTIMATGPRVTDAGMDSLSQLPKLFSLSLIRTSVTGAGLRRLQEMPRLSNLTLTTDTLSVDDLRQLKHVSRLRSLSLRSLADEGQLQFLEDVEQISSLTLESARLSPQGVDIINRLTKLRRVGLSLVDARDEQLIAIGRLKVNLTLTVQQSPKITDAGWKCLEGAGIQRLTILKSNLTDAGMASIANCDKLEMLMIFEAPITDAAIEHLLALPHLRYLSLHKTRVSDEGRKRLEKERPGLRLR